MRVGGAQVVGHGGAEMRFAGQQNGFGATGQVGFVFLRQEGDGEGGSAEGGHLARRSQALECTGHRIAPHF